jgi:nucleoside-diphosphate-sugar epimerase
LRADLAEMSLAGMPRQVFVTGGTGYLGRPLVSELIARGHVVRVLVRPGSEQWLPAGVLRVPGNALDASTFASHVPPADTLVDLIGTPRPSPAKAAEFRAVDLVSFAPLLLPGHRRRWPT